MTASQGKITTAADQQIVWMTAGGAYIKLAGGNFEMGAPGGCTIKAAKHVYVGPASKVPVLPVFSGTICVECMLKARESASALAKL